jgi:UDP-2-acetamido-2-deoxy-ribo-hexuluronate aminotransferase
MQFIDLKAQYAALKTDIDAAIQQVLDHGQYIMGPEVAQLETALAARVGVGHCVTVASGTEALLIALMALDLQPGDEVITSPFTFAATAEVIALLGGVPVFVDVEPDTGLIDAGRIEAAITPRTRALMPVSLYGQVPDMDAINAIAARHGLPVIEDAAQSFGAVPRAGQLRRLDHRLHQLLPQQAAGLLWRRWGPVHRRCPPGPGRAGDPRAWPERALHHTRVGVGGRMDTIQCAVLLAKLPRLDWELQRRRELGARYHALLADVNVGLLTVREGRDSVWGQYTVTVADRPAVQAALKAVGIPTAVHYPRPLHQQLAYERFAPAGGCPVAEQLAQQVMSLPMSPDLGEADQDRVVAALAAAVGRRG